MNIKIIVNWKEREVLKGTTVAELMRQLHMKGYYAVLNYQPVCGDMGWNYQLRAGDDVKFIKKEIV